MVSLVVAIIGLAAVAGFLAVIVSRARVRRELSRRRRELATQRELEDFIRRVDQVTTGEELDHLGREKRDD